jgi:FtsH ternary system domain X6
MTPLSVREEEEPILALARELFAQAPEPVLRARLERPCKSPPRLSPGGMKVFEETLAKGAAQFVARNGAWRKEGGARLWERAAPPPLVFTAASLQFLRWLVSTGERPELAPLLPTRQPAATGDELLLVAALAATEGTAWQGAVAWQPMVRESALCAAGFAATLGAVRSFDAVPAFDLSPGGWHAFAFEGLAELFAHHWAESELGKRHESVPARLQGASMGQARVLDALLAAAVQPGARGALTFLLEAGKRVLAAQLSPQAYGSNLSNRSSLRERSEARQASGSMLRGLQRLFEMDSAHRHTRFTDDGYEVAQALVARWQAAGPTPAQWASIEPTLSALGAA